MAKNTLISLPTCLAHTSRPLILDGGMGTVLQSFDLAAADFGGENYAGCFEYLALHNPAPLQKAHQAYLDAGADIIETCTFGASPIVLQEFGLAEQAYAINQANAQLAKSLASKASTPDKPRFVAGSLGPTTKSLTLQHLTFEEMVDNYYPQALGLYDGGIDYFLLETANDPLTLKAARIALKKVLREKHDPEFPVALSATFSGQQMLAGQDIRAYWAITQAWRPFYLGLNCITEGELPLLNFLLQHATCPVAVMPNNGLPNEHGQYAQTPARFLAQLKPFLNPPAGRGLKLVGGCCGTTPAHIKALAEYISLNFSSGDAWPTVDLPPKSAAPQHHPSVLAGTTWLNIDDLPRPIIAGERTNVLGAKSFREAVQKHDWAAATEIAKGQIKNHAQILDLCFAHPDGQEKEDCTNFLQTAAPVLKVPLMIDSINLDVVQAALKRITGKAIINSANLEHGIDHFKDFLHLAQDFGAALVVGTIGQNGMALMAQDKLAVAREVAQLCQEENFPLEDIYFDPLVFPCASGDQKYHGMAQETLRGLTLIKQNFPAAKTILGISNVSFGLPLKARHVLNAVLLAQATEAGLDVAIANPLHLMDVNTLDPQLVQLAQQLLRGEIPPTLFADQFRESKTPPAAASAPINLGKDDDKSSLNKKIQQHLIEGTTSTLLDDLGLLLKQQNALSIINEVLLSGMQIVGQLFNEQQLIIAEVLQAAQVMKKAIDFLQPHLAQDEAAKNAKTTTSPSSTQPKAVILLATVKGDVHDIGKNLVDIILSNNGFKVIDLGIKVPSEVIIKAFQEYHPDMIALSGLLVKSAYQMASMAEDFTQVGIKVPLLVGGAALSAKFTAENIAPHYQGLVYYNKDAMHGLFTAEQIAARLKAGQELPSPASLLQTPAPPKPTGPTKISPLPNPPTPTPTPSSAKGPKRSFPTTPTSSIVNAPNFDAHVITYQLWDLAPAVHHVFYTRHLGLTPAIAEQIAQVKDFPQKFPSSLNNLAATKYLQGLKALHEVLNDYANHLSGRAIYQFVPAYAAGDDVVLGERTREGAGKEEKETQNILHFTRQQIAPYHCLSDWVWPQSSSDQIALFIVTVGQNLRRIVHQLKEQGEFLKSHLLAAYALESAEALVHLVHQQVRNLWQIAPTQGQRYSFGHASCPNLDNQQVLFNILHPEQIGVTLTEAMMMEPEASVSGIILAHPEACYFDALAKS